MKAFILWFALLGPAVALGDYTLQSTGQAADAIAVIRVDEDGVTLKEFVNGWTSTWNEVDAWTDNDTASMTVDDPVSVGSATWKGTSFPHFESFADGSFGYSGVVFADDALLMPQGSSDPGIAVFAAFAGMGSGGGSDFIFETNAGSDGVFRSGSATGPIAWRISSGNFTAATTDLPADGTTKFSFGANYEFNASQSPDPDYFYGLESGSLAGDGNYSAQARGAATDDLKGIGGRTGSGNNPQQPFIYAIFNSPRTLAQMQALHDDWHGELFEESAGGQSPAPIILQQH